MLYCPSCPQVKQLLETATRVYNEDIAGNDRWTGHLDPSLLDYTQDPKYGAALEVSYQAPAFVADSTASVWCA